MTRFDLACLQIEGALRLVPGDLEIQELPCGIDVTVTLPPWRSVAYWQPIASKLADIACPISTRVIVVTSWSVALGHVAFLAALVGVVVFLGVVS